MTTTIKCYVSLTNGSAVVTLTAGNAGNAGLNLSAPNVIEDMLLVLQDPVNAIRFVKGSLSTTSFELQEPWNGATVTNAQARISTSGAAISVLTQAIRDLINKYAAVPYGNDGLTLADTMMRIVGSVDPTKVVKFEVDGLSTGTTRTVTVPDADVTIPTQAQMDAKFDKTGGTITGNVAITGALSALGPTSEIRLFNAAGTNWAVLNSPKTAGDTEVDFRITTKTGFVHIDQAGNLGIGVTPAPHLSSGYGGPLLQVGSRGSILGSATDTEICHNVYYASGFWRYIASGVASAYRQTGGAHYWSTAPSGTAGNPITWTQGMALDASGNLNVGGTSSAHHLMARNNPGNWVTKFENSAATNPYGIYIKFSGITGGMNDFVACEDDAIRFRVLGNGNVQNVNNSYGGISDLKFKNVLGPAKSYWDKYKLVQWIKYILIADPDQIKMLGVLAQQLREVFPGLIEEIPDFEEVVVEPDRVDKRVEQRQRVNYVESVRYENVNCDGQWRALPIRTTVEVPLFDAHPLFDQEGAPIMEIDQPEQAEELDAQGNVVVPFKAATYRQAVHNEPVMDEVVTEVEVPAKIERRPTGTTSLSVKYSILGTIADVVTQEAQLRIEALEAESVAQGEVIASLLERVAALEGRA